MNGSAIGALLGGVAGLGLLLVLSSPALNRRPDLGVRVLPYVRDLPAVAARVPSVRTEGPFRAVFGPALTSAAAAVERLLGGAASVHRRLDRAGLPMTVHDFRVEQVLWGLAGLVLAAVPAVLVAVASPGRTLPLVLLCASAFVSGVLLRENRLTAQATARERRILEELPTVVELFALAVAAGEGPVSALDRVSTRCRGAMADELRGVLAEVRTGTPLSHSLDALAGRTGVPAVARFAEAVAVAVDRGTPLAAVLHAQAGDAREAGRRALLETGARREVLMMVPVVFLILPVTVLFAFWPGLVGLRLVAP